MKDSTIYSIISQFDILFLEKHTSLFNLQDVWYILSLVNNTNSSVKSGGCTGFTTCDGGSSGCLAIASWQSIRRVSCIIVSVRL